MPPRTYLTSTYYELWLAKLDRLLADHSAVLHRGTTFTVDDVERVLARGTYVRPATSAPRFAKGDRVRARNIHPRTHTRLPRYVRGHVGVVHDVHRPNVFPDSVVRGDGEQPQWLYTVSFEGSELWGEGAEPGTAVAVNAFETYLEPA